MKILKSLLGDTITNTEVISLIQEQIDQLEATIEEQDDGLNDSFEEGSEEDLGALFGDEDTGSSSSSSFDDFSGLGEPDFSTTETDTISEPSETSSEDTLPSPADLGVGDFSDATNPELV